MARKNEGKEERERKRVKKRKDERRGGSEEKYENPPLEGQEAPLTLTFLVTHNLHRLT